LFREKLRALNNICQKKKKRATRITTRIQNPLLLREEEEETCRRPSPSGGKGNPLFHPLLLLRK
jgi:hypothetical protein